MTRGRKFLIAAALVVLVLAGAVAYVLTNLDGIVKRAIERYGSEATKTAVRVGSVSVKLARGEGALGALVNDDELYGDLAKLVRGTERSWILRTLIRSSIRRGEAAKAEDGRQAVRPGRTP